MANWGLDYDRLKEANPKLIMLSMSGFGQTGPWKNFVAYGPNLQSLGGLTYLTAYSKDEPAGLGYAHADIISGLYSALAILAALEFLDSTDTGQHIDLSEYEAVCTAIGPTLMEAFVNQYEIHPRGNDSDYFPAAPYACYKCAGEDRWCVIGVTNDDQWQALCRIVGNPAWSQMERFSTLSMRKKHKKELDRNIEKWTISQTAESLMQSLQQMNIPAGVVQNAANLSKDIQLLSRNFFVPISHPTLGELTVDTSPVHLTKTPRGSFKASPMLGEDSWYVYEELLGLSKEKIQSYKKGGIIA
jgi:crotonobetainyl-CoA:carnitine CoA-transferase CaiB-like acyl-CoA transferase